MNNENFVNPYEQYIAKQSMDTYVKYDDVRSVVSHANNFANMARQATTDVVKFIFMAGCVLAKNRSNINLKEVSDAIHMDRTAMTVAVQLAKECEYSVDNLTRFLAKNKIKTWTGVVDFYSEAQEYTPSQEEVKHYVNKAINHFKDGDNWQEILANIVKKVPMRRDIADKMHIKYHRCACCLKEPPPDGHNYEFSDELSLHIPICNDCLSTGHPVNYKEVARMYSVYAVNMEMAFDKIIYDANENNVVI